MTMILTRLKVNSSIVKAKKREIKMASKQTVFYERLSRLSTKRKARWFVHQLEPNDVPLSVLIGITTKSQEEFSLLES